MASKPISLERRAERLDDLQVKNTTCYMCACRCGIRVHLRDGEVRYIDGNPEHPINKGVICAKGASGIMKQKSPARLTKPLLRKRGAERGSGEFEAISWDRAFEILEQRLAHIRATDPKKFALFTGRAATLAQLGDASDWPAVGLVRVESECGGLRSVPAICRAYLRSPLMVGALFVVRVTRR